MEIPLEYVKTNNHILLAVDGSGSLSWMRKDGLNSHVYRFYKSFNGIKDYLAGPSTDSLGGMGDGDSVGNIIDKGFYSIYKMIGQSMKINNCNIENVKINIIGHSRGGYIALKIANLLEKKDPVIYLKKFAPQFNISNERVLTNADQFGMNKHISPNTTFNFEIPTGLKVNFIGLYDCVDMSLLQDAADLNLKNVAYVAHAQRTKSDNYSRVTFKPINIPKATLLPLDTSHGGIGGDPGFFNPLKKFIDLYCNARNLVPSDAIESVPFPGQIVSAAYGLVDPLYAGYWNSKKNTPQDIKRFYKNSQEADNHIRNHAVKSGIVLATADKHEPYKEYDSYYFQKLKRIAGL